MESGKGYSLAIVGGRSFKDYERFCHEVQKYTAVHGVPHTVVSGGAQGVDSLAKRWAHERFIRTLTYYPEYNKYNPMFAPLHRNTGIVQASDRVLAFPVAESKGTWDTVEKAKRFGKPCTVIPLP